MSEITNEKNGEMMEKLKYLGLDLDNVPDFIKNVDTIDFRPDRTYSDDTYKVYKCIPINDIQIVITKANRMSSIQEKYKNASSLYNYIVPQTEEDMYKYKLFLDMLKKMDIDNIEEMDKEQNEMNIMEPFSVKYKKDYLWEIYYSVASNKYFLLVNTEDVNFDSFFYLLREQIKNRSLNKSIYVPISYMDYSRILLGKDEFKDLEKYVWQFTKEWPMIYEVYDKDNNHSVQICGKTIVYGKLESIYKIKLSSKEEATKFFKLIKALFILSTEFPRDYDFEIQIAQNGGIEFVYNTKIINYENLATFIKNEYKKKSEALRIIKKEEKILRDVLANLKKIEEEQEKEYLYKQNQVATFMQCRKSFFGKVRYFFKGKLKQEILKTKIQEPKIEVNEDEIKQEYDREFYTIEDLTNVCKELNTILTEVKNIRMDKRALELKNNQLKVKINNATKFIEEIENHKKSIFEFWKFANKDNGMLLEAGNIQEEKQETVIEGEEYFDYVEDKEELGIKIDENQRKILTKEETDIIYLMKVKLLNSINAIKANKQYNFSSELENLKNDMRSLELLFGTEDYDIFGNSMGDRTRIETLGGTKHREKRKDEYRILDINSNTDTISYVSKLHGIIKTLDEIFSKDNLGIKINVFKASNTPLDTKAYNLFHINPEIALQEMKNEDVIGLYSIHLTSKTPAVALSNIVYYDNFNKTLPLGMDIDDEILLDMEKMNIELKRQKLFRMNIKINEFNIKTKTICVYEYELKQNN